MKYKKIKANERLGLYMRKVFVLQIIYTQESIKEEAEKTAIVLQDVYNKNCYQIIMRRKCRVWGLVLLKYGSNASCREGLRWMTVL